MSAERVDARRQSVWCISVGGGWWMSRRRWPVIRRCRPMSLRAVGAGTVAPKASPSLDRALRLEYHGTSP